MFVCFLPEAVRLWEMLQADGQLKQHHLFLLFPPHIYCLLTLLAESDILGSMHISSFKNYRSIYVGKNVKLPLNCHLVHSKHAKSENIKKQAVYHIKKSYRTPE